jgi:subtilase family serine protease
MHGFAKSALLGAVLWAAIPPARAQPAAAANRRVAFDVLLPLRHAAGLEGFVADLHNPSSANFHHWVSPAEFGLRFGPDAATVQQVASALLARGFSISVQTRSVHAVGQAGQAEASFGTRLLEAGGHLRAEKMPVSPTEIAGAGGQVFSFSPHGAHSHAVVVTGRLDPKSRLGATGGYWFDDLKQAYGYPSVVNPVRTYAGARALLDGTGVTVAVLMSSDVYDADIAAVFEHENWAALTNKAVPVLFGRVYVNGGASTASPALAEASLDVQQVITGAPGAHVVLYDIPDLSDGNIVAGYISIIEGNTADVVSSSFGGCERAYSPAYNGGQSYFGVLQAEHELFLQGNAQGITFIASSGDNAGKGCPAPSYYAGGNSFFAAGVETPASDPNVTAVGGTNLVTRAVPGSLDSTYVGENGWSDPEVPYDPDGIGATVSGGFWGAGGGYSVYFARPSWQTLVNTGASTKRAVPDVGMQVGGCPGGIAKLNRGKCTGGNLAQNGAGNSQRSFYIVSIGAGQTGGGFFGVIGTSVAAPEFAGATALMVEQQGRQGNLNPYLYGLAAQQALGKGVYFHTGIAGFNGLVGTRLNGAYSLTVGVGTPIVGAFVNAGTVVGTGAPQTVSNP